MKRVGVIIWTLLLCVVNLLAVECWQTHFAYNSVQVIAMDKDEVYALANGKLFSINQQNEHLTLFTNFSGLHGTEIVYIAYDDLREQLLIFYADGKIDTETITSSFIGYAPYEDPKMSIIVTSPDSSHPNSSTNYASLVTYRITQRVTETYYAMYGY